jgi:Putative peptidoglycan binding domain
VTRRRLVFMSAVLGAAVAGSVATIAVRGGSTAPTTAGLPPLSTATVVRTNLATTALTAGTLGYAPTEPVVNRVAGTYTALPSPGAIVDPGGTLYRVDDLPIVLMAGTIPAWRSFTLGMTDGPDVTQLQADLVSLGDARGLLSAPTGVFGVPTMDAVERWQSSAGYPADGQIPLGHVVFLPGPVRVGAASVSIGQAASPGDVPYQTTTATRAVTVPVDPSFPTVSVGEPVAIVLPTNAAAPGRITAIGPASPGDGAGGAQGSSNSGSGTGGSQQSQPTAVLTVTPDRPSDTGTASGVPVQVSLTTQSATDVLAVPISALLALTGGGYGVEVIGPSGAHHLVGVTTGIFTGSQVQVTGAGINASAKVVVAQ